MIINILKNYYYQSILAGELDGEAGDAIGIGAEAVAAPVTAQDFAHECKAYTLPRRLVGIEWSKYPDALLGRDAGAVVGNRESQAARR